MFVLHGHLPWVNHPEHEFFLEEDWLFEAVADCYLPLIKTFFSTKRHSTKNLQRQQCRQARSGPRAFE